HLHTQSDTCVITSAVFLFTCFYCFVLICVFLLSRNPPQSYRSFSNSSVPSVISPESLCLLTDCYRYTSLVSAEPVVLEGPNMQRSSCLWHLRAPAGSRLELRVEWLLSECRDRLIIYDSVTPTDSRLITSLYGCSRYEQTVQLLSSADWMTVVWKQGLYSYKDPFSLSVRACVVLEKTDGVQGILQTPFYPSYYPPDTNCTWIFTVPSVEFGLTLSFEGYELNRASYSQTCTQGRWSIQSRRGFSQYLDFVAPSDSRFSNSCISAKYCPILTNHTSMEAYLFSFQMMHKSQFHKN
uniref:CUB domain-containing protein n=1 Tax=Sinocyclocheilus rhinocerous TaxID=307959 RepID=A0A673MDG8_9TELE